MNSEKKKQLLPTIARYLLGTIFFVFGLNGFLHFIPQPPLEPGAAATFLGGLFSAPYMLYLVKGIEVAGGLSLLTNRYAPLSLALLAPITVNIVLFHAFLAPAGIVLTIVLLAAHLAAAWGYRALYRPMLVAKPEGSAPQAQSVSEIARATA